MGPVGAGLEAFSCEVPREGTQGEEGRGAPFPGG